MGMKIKKNGKIISLSESDLKRITMKLIKEQGANESETVEKTTGLDVLTNPEWLGYKEPVNAVYVFDIDRKTCKLFEGGKLIVDNVVGNIKIEGDIIKIQSIEPSLEKAEAIFETEFEINLKTNESSLTWYNSYADYTRTQKNTRTTISIKKTLAI